MSLQPFVHYNRKQDKVIGFEDWGIQRTRKFADHVIVFYIRCLASGNHMPLGYGFCQSATRTVQLLNCIKQWLIVLINCGFKPKATVCDQGGTNMAAVNMFIKESNDVRRRQNKNPKNTFLFKNHEIVPLYDYVHLQKGFVNTLLGKMYLPPSAAMTGNIILFFDKLFDSFNQKKNKEFNSIINLSSNHISFWQNAVNRISKMDFVDNESHKYV
ncbi:PREDICTED: uncharacterized protein LOC108779617 isoform X1 [Cyphomyrmex costatus]|uniref:uncharacterized protein LOC108779617 isoform X1 n=1 Tax=Cyphomyrmex costatus TaxID=456900 RepID=UPI0008523679|nr:PREDICTED: uncharacterized protein LOC108779617 isoform X1 [Cyphomyrmex costatus]